MFLSLIQQTASRTTQSLRRIFGRYDGWRRTGVRYGDYEVIEYIDENGERSESFWETN